MSALPQGMELQGGGVREREREHERRARLRSVWSLTLSRTRRLRSARAPSKRTMRGYTH